MPDKSFYPFVEVGVELALTRPYYQPIHQPVLDPKIVAFAINKLAGYPLIDLDLLSSPRSQVAWSSPWPPFFALVAGLPSNWKVDFPDHVYNEVVENASGYREWIIPTDEPNILVKVSLEAEV